MAKEVLNHGTMPQYYEYMSKRSKGEIAEKNSKKQVKKPAVVKKSFYKSPSDNSLGDLPASDWHKSGLEEAMLSKEE